MWARRVESVVTILEEPAAAIFRVEERCYHFGGSCCPHLQGRREKWRTRGAEECCYYFRGSCHHHLQGKTEKYTLKMGAAGSYGIVVPTRLHSITSHKIIILMSFLMFKCDLFYGATEYKESFSTSFNYWSCLMSLIFSADVFFFSLICIVTGK